MPSLEKIVLVGPMGAGKSTVGRLLARELSLPFKDSDAVVEARSGVDIPWIFDEEGEAGFRQRETAVLAELMQEEALVLATGGGIVLCEKNRRLLQQAQAVIYLSANVEQLLKRTEKDKKRPLLQVANPREKIQQLLAEREALYRQVATQVMMTEAQNPKVLVSAIVSRLRETA
ncbi:MAG: shikimate kinase [Cellvibrionaceae bacterium]|nr:shikimate kinase [Cellvibrionaceae bacterium]